MSSIDESKLRVLVVTDCADVYGAERWNAQLARGLHAKGHRVAVAQPTADNDVTRELAQANIRQYWTTPAPPDDPWRTFAADGPNSLDHAEARFIIGDAQPDVIVFSDGEPGSNLAAKEVAHRAGVPSIVVSHLGDDVDAKERTFGPPVLSRIAAALNNARAVVGVSRANVASLATAFNLDDSRLHVVPNGRPPRYFAAIDPSVRADQRRTLGITDDQVLLLTVARAHRNKQYSIQIDALRRLQSHAIAPNVRCVWVGGGPGLVRLRAAVQLNALANIVNLGGYVGDPSPYFAAADAFVLPSAREGAPLAVVEAMGAGLPVIATDVGGVADLLGNTGILLPDPNVDRAATVAALHDSIVRVACDPELRRRLGAAARARATAQFAEQLMIDRYEVLLRAAAKA